MKIGFVFDDSLDGTDGVQQYILRLGDWLRQQGHEVHYLVGQTARQDIPHVHSLSRNLNVRFNGNRLSIPLPATRRRLKALLQREQFDVLHVQVPYSPWLAGRVVALAGPKTAVIGTFHIAPYSKLVSLATRLLAIWSHRSLRRFDTMLSVSTAAAEFAARTYRIDSEVVPNVFDFELFHRSKPLEAYDDNIPTVMFLGRLVARKGCMQLLQAVNELRTSNLPIPSFRVVICGGGALDATLKTYVREHELTDMVTFAGRVSEEAKPRYLASADIAVFPSKGGESFGIVLLEAMASGRAVVLGGDNPGYKTVLGAYTELLFDTKNTADLVQKLVYFLGDSAARQAAANWGAIEAAGYDVNIIGKKLLKIYTKAFAQNSSKES